MVRPSMLCPSSSIIGFGSGSGSGSDSDSGLYYLQRLCRFSIFFRMAHGDLQNLMPVATHRLPVEALRRPSLLESPPAERFSRPKQFASRPCPVVAKRGRGKSPSQRWSLSQGRARAMACVVAEAASRVFATALFKGGVFPSASKATAALDTAGERSFITIARRRSRSPSTSSARRCTSLV